MRVLRLLSILVAALFLGTTASHGFATASTSTTVYIRDDDGSRNSYLDFDYTDDTALKYLEESGELTGATSAVLKIYGIGQNCGASGGSQHLSVNGVRRFTYDPCSIWSHNGYSWATFTLSLSWLQSGLNAFEAEDDGASYTDRGVYFGIDTSNDVGRSVIEKDYTDYPEELMWYLEITKSSSTCTGYPKASISASPQSGTIPFSVTFSLSGTPQSGCTITSWRISYGDGAVESGTGAPPASKSHSYTKTGEPVAELMVWQSNGKTHIHTTKITAIGPPDAPAFVFGAASAPSEIDVSWYPPFDGGSPITSYRVYGGKYSYDFLGQVSASTRTFKHTNLDPGTHKYRVTAVNALGESKAGTTSHRAYHEYVVELKAWIPHGSVVDPNLQLPKRYDEVYAQDGYRACHSPSFYFEGPHSAWGWFQGDSHAAYDGTYRVKSTLSFKYDGASITGASEAGDKFGPTVLRRH